MKKISVIIPMYYEEEVAEECYKRMTSVLQNIENYDYEIICINDGSRDKTLSILENLAIRDKRLKVLSFSRNFGHQCAIQAGRELRVIVGADKIDDKATENLSGEIAKKIQSRNTCTSLASDAD